MRYLASAIGGFLLAAAFFSFFVIPKVQANWLAQGQNEGKLQANVEMHKKVAKHFPKNTGKCFVIEILGGAKPNTIDIVDCGSFRTLQVSEE